MQQTSSHQAPAVAVLGRDYPRLRPVLHVEPGDRVVRGQTLVSCRKHAHVRIAAPVAGKVGAILRGPRRSIERITVEPDGGGDRVFDTSADPMSLLVDSGLWCAIRARPFGHIANPADRPALLLVTAMFSAPGAAGAGDEIAVHAPLYLAGMELLSRALHCDIVQCVTNDGAAPPPDAGRIVQFGRSLRDRMIGSHVLRLAPPTLDRPVWQIGFQDVIEAGHLATEGHLSGRRSIWVAGGPGADAAIVRAVQGAALKTLADGHPPAARLAAGVASRLHEGAYLGRYDDLVSPLTAPPTHTPARPPGPILPLRRMAAVVPWRVDALPLMRALASGDIRQVERLGGLALTEDDVALLTPLCSSGNDYAALLRAALTTQETQ